MRAGRPRSQEMPDHSPLEGESQKPSRQAKADAVGGPTNTRHLAAGSASDRHSQGAAFPPTGSTAGCALPPDNAPSLPIDPLGDMLSPT